MAKRGPDWSLKNLDTGEVFKPQFRIEREVGVSVSGGSTLGDRPRFGQAHPLTQWLSGKLDVVTFPTRLYAEHYDDNLKPKVEKLEKLARKDESLGRAPVCLFTYGNFLSEKVWVESVNPVYRGTLPNGNAQDVLFNITLKRYEPFDLSSVDPNRPKKESYYHQVKGSEPTYEGIARQFHGDPLMGVLLRRRNPAHPTQPPVGSIIKVPSRRVLSQEAITPASHVFDTESTEAWDLLARVAEARGQQTTILVS